MNKHLNIDKLFSEKLQSIEQDTTPEFDKVMERKIDNLYLSKYFRWIIGCILAIGIVVAISLLSRTDIESKQPNKVTQTKLLSSPPLILKDEIHSTKENPILEETQIYQDSLILDSSPKIVIPLKREEQFLSNKQKALLEKESKLDLPIRLNTHLSINQLIISNSHSYIIEKEHMYPASVVNENYLTKKKAKAKKAEKRRARKKEKELNKKEKQNKRITKKPEKKNHENRINGKDKKSFSFLSNKELKNKAEKRKKSKFEKQKVAGNYAGALEISSAPLFINNLSPPLEPENHTVTNWLTNKDFKTSYDIGFEFMFKQKESNWLFKSGLHYQNISEEINYYFLREHTDEQLSYWVYDSIFEYYNDPPNFDTILISIDSSYYDHRNRSETAKKHSNHYQYLNIPILLGYQIDMRKPTTDPDFKKGFNVHVIMGMGLGILLKSDGYYYDTGGYVYPYPTLQKTTIDWYLNAQVAINYHWKNISLFAKPKLQFQMRERPFDAYFENRHYLIYGIDFGVRIKIF